MLRIRTVTELKQRLPEVLDRIDHCKLMYNVYTKLLQRMREYCIKECVDETIDFGWFTTKGAYMEVLRNRFDKDAEAKHLQGLVDKLPAYKNQII